jgi:hypothetical protein
VHTAHTVIAITIHAQTGTFSIAVWFSSESRNCTGSGSLVVVSTGRGVAIIVVFPWAPLVRVGLSVQFVGGIAGGAVNVCTVGIGSVPVGELVPRAISKTKTYGTFEGSSLFSRVAIVVEGVMLGSPKESKSDGDVEVDGMGTEDDGVTGNGVGGADIGVGV